MNKQKQQSTVLKRIEINELSNELLLDMYRRMVQIRKFEDTIHEAYIRGIMPGLAHLYTGMEAVAVGVCITLSEKDNITSTHRGHGHLLAKGGDPARMMAELFGKSTGYNKGKGGSMHIVDLSLGILGANGIVGGGLGIATGAALSSKLTREDRISISFFGDGALNQGLFYEVANMASVWKLPIVYVSENNQFGEYTRTSKVTAGTAIARANALEIPAVSVDGNDVVAVYAAALWGTNRARKDEGPSFIECKTYRFRGHHSGDQGDTYRYRTMEEVEENRKNCPILRFADSLIQNRVIDRDELDAIDEDVQDQIDQAFEYGKSSPFPDPSEAFEDIYA